MKHWKSLRFRFALLMFLILIPVLVLQIVNTIDYRARMITEVKNETLRLARLIESQQSTLIELTRQLLRGFAQLDYMRAPNSSQCSLAFSDIVGQYSKYINFGVADQNGNVICSGLPLTNPVNISDRKYFQDALLNGDFSVGSYQIGRITGSPAINFGYPIYTDSAEPSYVIVAALGLDWLNELAFSYVLPENSAITILDEHWTIIFRQPDYSSWVGKSLPDAPIIDAALGQSAEASLELTGVDGVRRLYAHSPINLSSGSLVAHTLVGIPSEIAFNGVQNAIIRNIATILSLAIIATLLAWIGSHILIQKPLELLQTICRRIADGDYKVSISSWFRHDEFGELAKSMDDMALQVSQSHGKLLHLYDETILCWGRALELFDKETEGHTLRVTKMTLDLAKEIGVVAEDRDHIKRGALLHDIGKIGISKDILTKKSPLTDSEWDLIREHPEMAYNILRDLDFLGPAIDIPHYHHERWDGTGYPHGLKGEGIPLSARIFSVVDAFDAMTHARPYRTAMPVKDALDELERNAGKQFDPEIVAAFQVLIASKAKRLATE